MKTKVIVEFETEDMKEVVPTEYIGEPEKCPKEEIMTKDIEELLHKNFLDFLKRLFVEKQDILFSPFEDDMIEDEACVEGFDNLKDYGKIKFNIKKIS